MGYPADPHLRVPMRLLGNRFQVLEGGTLDEVVQNVTVLVSTRTGERKAVPSFGIADPTFRRVHEAMDPAEVISAVGRFEDRAVVELEFDDTDPAAGRWRVLVGMNVEDL